MYYYEKDYIMRLIHGIARMLARLFLGIEMEEEGEPVFLRDREVREHHDYLRQMIDAGRVNAAEEKLFDLLDSAVWDNRQKASLALAFYDYLNGKDDDFLAAADFSRDEIIRGMEDALTKADIEIPEYLRI